MKYFRLIVANISDNLYICIKIHHGDEIRSYSTHCLLQIKMRGINYDTRYTLPNYTLLGFKVQCQE